MNKKVARLRRSLKTKHVIRKSGRARLVVHRSLSHIYAQIIIPGADGDVVLVSCSSLDKELRATLKGTKKEIAFKVGQVLGQRAKAKNIVEVAFDRAGYPYHGRVQELAQGARDAGLEF